MGRRMLLVAAVGMGLVVPGAAQAQSAAQDSVEGTALACRQPPNGCLSLPPGQFGTFLRLTAESQRETTPDSPTTLEGSAA